MNDQAKDFESGAARMAEMTDMFIEQIRKLAELHKEGILTDEEFSAKKGELLSRL
jgi:putative oligomerization/nucleic acid binding protein